MYITFRVTSLLFSSNCGRERKRRENQAEVYDSTFNITRGILTLICTINSNILRFNITYANKTTQIYINCTHKKNEIPEMNCVKTLNTNLNSLQLLYAHLKFFVQWSPVFTLYKR